MSTAVFLGKVLQFPITLKQGADVTINLTVVNAMGQPITDPTGWATISQIRPYPGGDLLFEWNTSPTPGIGTASLTYSSATNTSTLALTVTGNQSIEFTWGSGVYDVFLTSPSGSVACIAEGTVRIDPATTMS